jgi:hypothetical protein
MATYSYVDVDLEDARLLADLNGAKLDLESVLSLSTYLQRRLSADDFSLETVDAFSTAILVRYSRPFMKGVRERLGENILQDLIEPQRKLHEKFIAWRNKHIAHSVNPFEDNRVVAYFNEEAVLTEGIQSISVQQNGLLGLGSQDLAEIQEVTKALLALVNFRMESEKSRILKIVRKMPVEDVLAKGIKPPQVPDMELVNKARSR